MNDVTRIGAAVGLIASAPDNTPVSGPHGPLTRRYAPTAATPCRDHSDGAQKLYITFSWYRLAGQGMGTGEIYQNGTGFAGLPAPFN